MSHRILCIFFISFISSIESHVKNSIVGDCQITSVPDAETNYTEDGISVTFVCISDYRFNNYFESSTRITCTHKTDESSVKIRSVPKYSFVKMNFESCSMSSVQYPIFEVYNHINILNISYLGLEMLQNDAFVRAELLTKLDVSHNNLTKVPDFLFAKTNKLIEVDFSFNKIDRIEPLAFGSKSILKHLDLSFNEIDELNANMFASAVKLRHLNLSHNSLSIIKAGTFCRQEDLLILDLTKNRLKMLDFNIFKCPIFLPRFNKLERLSIANNHLRELNGFSNLRFPFVRIDGIDQNEFDCKYLNELFRSFYFAQFDLSFEDNSNHPKISDPTGANCTFTDLVYVEKFTNQCNFVECFAAVCILLLIIIICIFILLIKQKKTVKRRTETIESLSAYCEARSNIGSFGNIYDVPKF